MSVPARVSDRAPTSPSGARARRRVTRLAAVVLAGVLLLGVAAFAMSWWRVDQLLHVQPVAATYSLHLLARKGNTITLERGGGATVRGTYGLQWQRGRAVLGRILSERGDRVVRRICLVSGAAPQPDTTIGLRNNIYWGDPRQLGLHFREVLVPSPGLGQLPGWLVPARGATWTILVHGLDGSRQDALQVMPTLHALGLPILDISYRNDAGAPQTSDGRSHLGASEWRDLDAAIGYAAAHGARGVVVFGYSMAGAMVAELLEHSPRASLVRGLVLDSPVLDWEATLRAQAARHQVPGLLMGPLLDILAARTGLDLHDVSLRRFSAVLSVPTLVIQGSADSVVPVGTSDRFAAMNRTLVSYERLTGVEHARAWNVDPIAYQRRLVEFLRPFQAMFSQVTDLPVATPPC